MTQFIPLFIGLAAGVASGLFGIGGGIIIVPMLSFFLGYAMQQAAATSLAALLLPVGALGVYAYWREGMLPMSNIMVAMLIAVGLAVGAYFGARLAIHMSGIWFNRIFAVFLVLVAIRIWLKAA